MSSRVKITDIRTGMKDIDVAGKVTKVERTQRSLWREHALAWLNDGSGEIRLNLWRDQIEQVHIGDVVHLRAAFARKYKGMVLELSTWEDQIEISKRARK
jgi:ssDNA-binding replication factor A large subunit